MRKKVIAIIILMLIICECSIIYNGKNKTSNKEENRKEKYVIKAPEITIIDILNIFENNPFIDLISIDDKIDNYEINIRIFGDKNKFMEEVGKLKDFYIVDYNMKLGENNIEGIFKLKYKK